MKLRSGPLLLTALLFTILIILGFWQLSRLKFKVTLLNQIASNLNGDCRELPNPLKDSDIINYTKFKLHGKFIPSKDILLYSSDPNYTQKQGYFVITPFLTECGKYILINRGWIPESYAKGSLNEKWKVLEGYESIVAAIMKPKLPSVFMLNNDPQNNLWLYFDLDAMGDFIEIPVEHKFYMTLLREENFNQGLTMMSIQNFLNLKNDHLWYAVTWFSLAFALIMIYYIKYK